MKFSILICHCFERANLLNILVKELRRQVHNEVEILVLSDDCRMKVGAKRNHLVSMATGEYVAFIDDDDWVGTNYVKRITDALAIYPGKDVYCFRVEYSDGALHKNTPVHYSIKYAHMPPSERNQPHLFYRSPNHLMVIKKDIVKACPFPEINNGEDAEFEKKIAPMIKSEYQIPEIVYYYRFSIAGTLAQKGRYGR